MFLVKRFRDVKGNKKIDIRDSSSGTLAYMCPTCFNIIYAHCNYDIHYKFDIDDVAMNINIIQSDWLKSLKITLLKMIILYIVIITKERNMLL